LQVSKLVPIQIQIQIPGLAIQSNFKTWLLFIWFKYLC
jgi:hypothetical protein